jgi:predicted transglutaminase-like cysteine proteinase
MLRRSALHWAIAFAGAALAQQVRAGDTLPLGDPAPAAIRPGREAARGRGTPELLAVVNAHYNALRQAPDIETWGREDYWATPAELAERGAGDCEDFAIAKFFELLAYGVAEDKLRLMLVELYDQRRMRIEMHMVLAYYAEPRGDPLILDSFDPEIRPLSLRADLSPRLSFNRVAWSSIQEREVTPHAGLAPISQWHELLARMHAAF